MLPAAILGFILLFILCAFASVREANREQEVRQQGKGKRRKANRTAA